MPGKLVNSPFPLRLMLLEVGFSWEEVQFQAILATEGKPVHMETTKREGLSIGLKLIPQPHPERPESTARLIYEVLRFSD